MRDEDGKPIRMGIVQPNGEIWLLNPRKGPAKPDMEKLIYGREIPQSISTELDWDTKVYHIHCSELDESSQLSIQEEPSFGALVISFVQEFLKYRDDKLGETD